MTRVPVMLTIAGSDPSGGAGIQADLKTATVLGVYGASVITALTAQNTCGVTGILSVSPAFIAEQYEAVVSDLNVRAIKIGMLGTAEVVHTIAELLSRRPMPAVVLDPVMVAASGDRLVPLEAVAAIREALLPLCTIVTPNLAEAQELTGLAVGTETDMETAGRALVADGAQSALVKGGHLAGPRSADVLVGPDGTQWFDAPRIETANTHGTGCTLSSAIAAQLVLGDSVPDAVYEAKSFLSRALESGKGLTFGTGHGPVDHLVNR